MLASDTGRALQTLSVVAEHIGADWHRAAVDPRLREINMGEWGGAYYRDLQGQLEVDQRLGLFMTKAPGGEDYPMIAERVRHWIAEQSFVSDMLIISHGMTSRVLRGVLTGLDDLHPYGAPIAAGLPQGSMVAICDGVETVLHLGGGEAERA
jgi:probable phosphoglycerate mutase